MSGEQETPESNIIEKQVRILPHPNRTADQQGLQASAVNSPCLRDVLGLSLKIKDVLLHFSEQGCGRNSRERHEVRFFTEKPHGAVSLKVRQ